MIVEGMSLFEASLIGVPVAMRPTHIGEESAQQGFLRWAELHTGSLPAGDHVLLMQLAVATGRMGHNDQQALQCALQGVMCAMWLLTGKSPPGNASDLAGAVEPYSTALATHIRNVWFRRNRNQTYLIGSSLWRWLWDAKRLDITCDVYAFMVYAAQCTDSNLSNGLRLHIPDATSDWAGVRVRE